MSIEFKIPNLGLIPKNHTNKVIYMLFLDTRFFDRNKYLKQVLFDAFKK